MDLDNGGRPLYIGATTDAWDRYKSHAASLRKVCAPKVPDGIELGDFLFAFIPTSEPWEIWSFEVLMIEWLNPLFNDREILGGIGSGGKPGSASVNYFADPSKLTEDERSAQTARRDRVRELSSDLEAHPFLSVNPPTE